MNKRKFRVRDNATIFKTLQYSVQIASKIEESCEDKNIPPYQMPKSVVPTDVLYDLVVSFEAMYNKLLEEELIQAGFPTSHKLNH